VRRDRNAELESTTGLNTLYEELQNERDSMKVQRDELIAAAKEYAEHYLIDERR